MMDFNLNTNEKKILLSIAREAITAHLERRQPGYKEIPESLTLHCGAFVTLHQGEKLRGCIGNMVGTKALSDTIQEMAVASAFQDPRFPPLEQKELPSLEIEISILSPMKKISDISEIIPGKHGLYLKNGYRSGVLLPQMASERGWDTETFLTNTCYKAGLSGDCWKDPDTEIFIYSAIVFNETQV
jgi:AmmeMemoRadiSam system protein A